MSTLHQNAPLIFCLMIRLTETYWDDETFQQFSVGPSFGEIQVKLLTVDEALNTVSRA